MSIRTPCTPLADDVGWREYTVALVVSNSSVSGKSELLGTYILLLLFHYLSP